MSVPPTKGTNDVIKTGEPEDITTTDKLDSIIRITKEPQSSDELYSTTTTDRAPVTTKSSTVILGNGIERNLAVVIGGSLAGLILLLVTVIAFILVIAVALYRAKHNKKNLRSVSYAKVTIYV